MSTSVGLLSRWVESDSEWVCRLSKYLLTCGQTIVCTQSKYSD